MSTDKPLPCLVCGFQPTSIDPHDGYKHVPNSALMFDAGSGHYGSGVWDTMNGYRSLTINVCDDCLVANRSRVAVRVTAPPERPSDEFLAWNPEADD